MTYSVTEPHPTLPKNRYAHCGRGGVGNSFRVPATSTGATAKGPASLFTHGLPQSDSKFSSGRGGAGNIRASSEKAVFSFDEELERQNTRERKFQEGAVWHTGRGGVGNWASSQPRSQRKHSTSSTGSDGSLHSGFLGRLSHTLDRH